MKKHLIFTLIILVISLTMIVEISCGAGKTKLTYQLNEAVKKDDVQAVRKLISEGADVNGSPDISWKPIHTAVQKKNLEIVELLVSRNADVNPWVSIHNDRRKTPLHMAVDKNDLEIAKVLISAGADLNARYVSKSKSVYNASPPIFYAKKEMMKLLIDSGANVNSRSADANEYTPLHLAVRGTKYREADIEVVKMLIDAGADVNAASRYGETPLDSARKRVQVSQYAWVEPRQDIIALLEQHGAKPGVPKAIDQIRKR